MYSLITSKVSPVNIIIEPKNLTRRVLAKPLLYNNHPIVCVGLDGERYVALFLTWLVLSGSLGLSLP